MSEEPTRHPADPVVESDAPGAVGATADAVVELTAVTKTFEGASPVHALVDCSATVRRGELVAIVGPSGSGKSTLLNIVGLLDTPTSGRYVLDGHDTATLNDAELTGLRAHRIGFVFQAFHLVAYRNVVENVELGTLYQHRRGGPRRRQRRADALDLLERVGLAARATAAVTTLSGGERQRVAIARALSTSPALLLCDEPTGNLDTATSAQILGQLDELHRDGLTIVVITHDPAVAAHAQRVLRIVDGVLSEPASEQVGTRG